MSIDLLPEHASAPDFVDLMATYESSYRKLRLLLAGLERRSPQSYVSVLEDPALALFVDVLEQHRFTTVLRMTYIFRDGPTVRLEPNAFVRMYHDARQAEATEFDPGRHLDSHGLSGQRTSKPVIDPRPQVGRLNRFLDRWLDLLLQDGHRCSTFSAARMSIAERLASGTPFDDARTCDNCTTRA